MVCFFDSVVIAMCLKAIKEPVYINVRKIFFLVSRSILNKIKDLVI